MLPTPLPDGVNLDSKVELIEALKSEGFLAPSAACHLPNIPERVQTRLFASLLYVARAFPQPFLLDPLVDYEEALLPAGRSTVGSFWTPKNVMRINPNHHFFTDPEIAEWGEGAWERFTNFLGGHVVHEGMHKLQAQHTVEELKQIDDAIVAAMGDWRAPYPNAFKSVGTWFTDTYGNYGKHLLAERDAMAIEFHAHGFRNPFSQAILDAYTDIHGPHRVIDGRPTTTARERVVFRAASADVRIGDISVGQISRQRGEEFECTDDRVYYFRAGDNRYMLANGHLVDVDDSIRQGRIIGEDFGTNVGFVIETGMPLSRNDPKDVPEQYVPRLVSEAVSASRSSLLTQTPKERDATVLSTNLVSSIYRDMHSVKAAGLQPVPSSQEWPSRMNRAHALLWEVPQGETASNVTALLPHAQSVQVRSSRGFDVSITLPHGGGYVMGRDTEGNRVNNVFRVDVDGTLAGLRAGGPLVLVDQTNGETYDYGRAVRVVAVEESPVPAAELEALVQLSVERPTRRSAEPLCL